MAADLNSVELVGRLTRDAEKKVTHDGRSILNFSIANNHSVNKGDHWEDEPYFFNCTLFGKQADSLAQYMTKGRQIALRGSLRQTSWTAETGQTVSRVDIVVASLQLLASPASQQQPQEQLQRPAQQNGSPQAYHMTANEQYDDSEIPF